MAEPRVVTAEQIRERLAARRIGAAPDTRDLAARADRVDATRERLRAAVVLLDVFRGESLVPLADEAAVAAFIANDCERVAGRTLDGWRLPTPLRRQVIAAFPDARSLVATLARVPGVPDDTVSQMAVALLEGRPDLGRRSPAELGSMLRALDWLGDSAYSLPSVTQVEAALGRADLLTPLRAVASGPFVGRGHELALLRAHVDRPGEAPVPLALHGPGGVGKSTLLAHFVLETVEQPTTGAAWFTFAYLTFDRPDISPQQPLSLLGEACRQLRFQLPDLDSELQRLAADIEAAVRLERMSVAEATPSRRVSSYDAGRERHNEENLVAAYARLLGSHRTGPLLWVMDTFEQAQRHGPAAVHRLGAFVDALRRLCPQVRVVIAGRADVHAIAAVNVPLLGFDEPGAREFLAAQLAPQVVEPALLGRVAAAMGGNALSLRLAAELIRRTGPEELGTEDGQARLLKGLEPERVQGMLYRRILDHVDRPEIRALANPGLALRRITPEIIEKVLAGPCRLEGVDATRAVELFEGLRTEVSLVYEEAPDVLVHRADVRREMLPLLAQDDPERVRLINEAAVTYYAGQTSVRGRAEEIYHRLALDQPSTELDQQWDPEVVPWLRGAEDELPPASRTYLAHKLGTRLGVAGVAEADDVAWLRKVTQEARQLLDLGRPSDALSLLESRPRLAEDRQVLPLRAEACAVLGQVDQALTLVDTGLGLTAVSEAPEEHATLAILAARICEDQGDYSTARNLGLMGLAAAQLTDQPLLEAAAMVSVVRVDRRSGTAGDPDADALRERLARLAASLPAYERASNPALLRELAAEVGAEVPQLLRETAAISGIDLDPPGTPAVAGEKLRSMTSEAWSGHSAGSSVEEYLTSSPDDAEAVDAVAEYFRSEVDAPSYDFQDDADGSGA